MLSITADHLRVFLHVLAATVWVGGQLTVVGLLPAVRGLGAEAPRAVARQFARVTWPAYAAVVATGLWNLTEVNLGNRTGDYQRTVVLKIALVAVSGIGAALHGRARSRAGLAVWGALGALAGLAALFLGVVLRG